MYGYASIRPRPDTGIMYATSEALAKICGSCSKVTTGVGKRYWLQVLFLSLKGIQNATADNGFSLVRVYLYIYVSYIYSSPILVRCVHNLPLQLACWAAQVVLVQRTNDCPNHVFAQWRNVQTPIINSIFACSKCHRILPRRR